MDFQSTIIYTLFLIGCCLLARKTEVSNYNPVWTFTTYIFVVIFWSIRYKIGYDYNGYVFGFKLIRHDAHNMLEPAYYAINWIFKDSAIGYIGVFAVMSIICYYFLFKLFIRERILTYGLFFSLAFQLQFMAANQIRQCFVLIVFLNIVHLLEEKKIWTFVKWSLCLMLFHISAIFLLLAIPFSKVRFSRLFWCILLLGTYVVYLAGFFRLIGNKLMSLLPLYERYQNTGRMEAEQTGFSIVMLFWIIVALYLLLYKRTIDRPVLFNIYFCGMIFYCAFFEYHLITRVMVYFTYLNVLLAGILCKRNQRDGLALIVISFIAYLLLCLKIPNLHGIQPYQTLFQEKIERV